MGDLKDAHNVLGSSVGERQTLVGHPLGPAGERHEAC
jgi:hypothetical protein